MVRGALQKVMWVGRATVFLVGLAVMLAVVFGAATTALAHSNVDNKLFHLGHSNKAETPTALVATLSDAVKAALVVNNKSGGPALSLGVAQNQAPLTVNADAGTATNLDADKLDGEDSAAYQRRVSGQCAAGSSIRSIGADGTTVACEPDDDGSTEQVSALREELGSNDGAPNEGSDPVSLSQIKDIPPSVISRDADTLDGKDSSEFAGTGKSTYRGLVSLNPCGGQILVSHNISPSRPALVYASGVASYAQNDSNLETVQLWLELRDETNTTTLASGGFIRARADGARWVPLSVQGLLMSGTSVFTSTTPFEVTPGNSYVLRLVGVTADGNCSGSPEMQSVALSHLLIGK